MIEHLAYIKPNQDRRTGVIEFNLKANHPDIIGIDLPNQRDSESLKESEESDREDKSQDHKRVQQPPTDRRIQNRKSNDETVNVRGEKRKDEQSVNKKNQPTDNESQSLDKKNRRLDKILQRYGELFDGQLEKIKGYKHKIEVKIEKPYRKTYPMKHQEEVARQIDEMEKLGVVRKEATDYVNPLVAVTKQDGDIRLCLDARAINAQTREDHAQPPSIDEVLAAIGRNRCYSKLDISKAYWQVEMEQKSKKYTGFLFGGQTFVFQRMPFGLKTAGASFTCAIDGILKNVPEIKPHLIVYLDDMIIFTKNENEHMELLDKLLDALNKAGVKLNRNKCEFLRDRIKFLGHEVEQTVVNITKETKQNIQEFRRPTNIKQVQAFLGLLN